jgi:hypothetical protein
MSLGRTPEEALEAMVKLWVEEYTPTHGGEADYLHQCREDIGISKIEPGRAYIRGSTDFLWTETFLTADDVRFDEIFEKYGPTPSAKP